MASPTIATADLAHGNTTGAASLALSVLAAVGSNASLILGIEAANAQTISTVVDSQGNAWTKDTTASQNGSGAARLDIWTCRVKYPLTTADTITITPSASTNMAAQCIHLTGAVVATGVPAPHDVVKTGTGTTTNSPTTGASPTLAVADELSIGFCAFTGNTTGFSSDSTGYTSRATVGNASGSLHIGTKAIAAVASPGTETYAPTLTGTPANSSVTLITIRGQTVRYVNVSTGSDANSGLSGGGTPFSNAKLTIAACGALSGDIVHIAKTPTPSASAGTSTWTSGSTTVSTTSDLTASIAAKDLVSTTADGSGGWWEVSAITATTITLVTAYRPGPSGLSGAGLSIFALTSAGGGYIGFNTAGNIQALTVDATKEDPIAITGGYDTTTDTRTGFTWMANTNATRQGIFNINHSFANISYIGMARTARAFSDTASGQGVFYDHCQAASSNGECFYKLSSNGHMSNCVGQPQGNQDAFSHASGGNSNYVYDTCVALSCGSGAGFNDNQAPHALYLNCYVDGSTATAAYAIGSQGCLLYNCTANHTTRGFNYSGLNGDIRLNGCVSSNAGTADFSLAVSADNFYGYMFNCLGNSGTVLVRSNGTFMIDKYQQTNGDYRQYQFQGSILSNTAQARSGTCVEIQPGQGLNVSSVSMGAAQGSDFGTRPDRFMEETWAIPVEAGAMRTITVYLKKSSTWNGFVVLAGVHKDGYWSGGTLPTNIVASGATILSTTYQQYTFTYDNTAGPDQVIDFALWVDGSAGSVYIDDIAWS